MTTRYCAGCDAETDHTHIGASGDVGGPSVFGDEVAGLHLWSCDVCGYVTIFPE